MRIKTHDAKTTMNCVKISPDGTVEYLEVSDNSADQYKQINSQLGGDYLEGLQLSSSAFAYIDEDGKMKELPPNPIATELCAQLGTGLSRSDFISGTMMIFGAADKDGENTECPKHIFHLASAIRELRELKSESPVISKHALN